MSTYKGPHQDFRMRVYWPPTEEDAADYALAVSPDVFDDFAGEEVNKIRLPREIGGVVLRRGIWLQANGNTKAHSGEEVEPTDIRLLED